MVKVVLFDKDGDVVVDKDYKCKSQAKRALAIFEENEDYDHGYVMDLDTGEIFESFGYVFDDGEVSTPSDECGFDPYEGCYTFDN